MKINIQQLLGIILKKKKNIKEWYKKKRKKKKTNKKEIKYLVSGLFFISRFYFAIFF